MNKLKVFLGVLTVPMSIALIFEFDELYLQLFWVLATLINCSTLVDGIKGLIREEKDNV